MPITPTGIPNIIFLENIIPVPAFPVLWLDEGADIDQVKKYFKFLKSFLYIYFFLIKTAIVVFK